MLATQSSISQNGVDSGPHSQCGTTNRLDYRCLVAGFKYWLKDYLPRGLIEAPKNYSKPVKLEEK